MYSTDIFYSRSTVISKKCSQGEILSGPPVFQDFRRPFLVFIFFETSTCSHTFFQRNWLTCHTSCSHPFLERPFIVKQQLQPSILSNLPCFFRIEVQARRYHSFQLNYQLWYLLGCRHVFIRRWVCCLMTSFTTIHALYGTVVIPREYFK